MLESDHAIPDARHPPIDWFDIHRASLKHVAEILGSFELVEKGLEFGSDGEGAAHASPSTPPTPISTSDLDVESGPARGSTGPLLTEHTPSGASRPPTRFSAPVGDDHPTRVYQSAGLRLFADDPSERGLFDDVPGPGPSSQGVANLTIKRPVTLALDLGCGGGYLSLLMTRFSKQVIGTDLNPRAVQLARINARWNGASNVEFRNGDLFHPVRRMVFDCVVSNPPFVVSPDDEFIYRDGGGKPGGLCDRIMADLPSFMAEGGFATVQCHWPVRSGEVWWERPARWVEESSCDLWMVSYGIQPPDVYARTWLGNARPGKPVSKRELTRWTEWYRRHSIEHIAAGVLILRKRTGTPNWARAIVAPRQPDGDCSLHLIRIFDAHDWLTTANSPGGLLDIPLGFPEGCRLRQEGRALSAGVVQVICEPDPGYSLRLSPSTAAPVSLLDGSKTPRALLDAQPGDERAEHEQLLAAELVRLYGAGMIVPGGQGGGPAIVETS